MSNNSISKLLLFVKTHLQANTHTFSSSKTSWHKFYLHTNTQILRNTIKISKSNYFHLQIKSKTIYNTHLQRIRVSQTGPDGTTAERTLPLRLPVAVTAAAAADSGPGTNRTAKPAWTSASSAADDATGKVPRRNAGRAQPVAEEIGRPERRSSRVLESRVLGLGGHRERTWWYFENIRTSWCLPVRPRG